MAPKTITVGELREQLAEFTDETRLYFGHGDISFQRLKNNGPAHAPLLQIEFNEAYDTQKGADLVD